MKHTLSLLVYLSALLIFAGPGLAQADKKQYSEVSLGALTLPNGSDGLLHWIGAEPLSQELQLSTRYFSERIKPKSEILRLYESPTILVEGEPIPEPLLTVKVPSGPGLIYLVVWSETGKDNKATWRSRAFSAKEWQVGTMKLINASKATLGLTAGAKKFKLVGGKSIDFHARDWPKPFPTKIYLTEPKVKNVFSSKWRITAASRELCFIAKVNGSISLRSLMDLNAAEPEEE